MKEIVYETHGLCADFIGVTLDESGKIGDISFVGGCAAMQEALKRMCKGLDPEDVAGRLSGIDCCGKGTSCPDQLADAIRTMLRKNEAGASA